MLVFEKWYTACGVFFVGSQSQKSLGPISFGHHLFCPVSGLKGFLSIWWYPTAYHYGLGKRFSIISYSGFKLLCPRTWWNSEGFHRWCLTAVFCGVFFSSSSKPLQQPCLLCRTVVSTFGSMHKSPMYPPLGWRQIKPQIVLSILKSAGAELGVQRSWGFV